VRVCVYVYVYVYVYMYVYVYVGLSDALYTSVLASLKRAVSTGEQSVGCENIYNTSTYIQHIYNTMQ